MVVFIGHSSALSHEGTQTILTVGSPVNFTFRGNACFCEQLAAVPQSSQSLYFIRLPVLEYQMWFPLREIQDKCSKDTVRPYTENIVSRSQVSESPRV